MFYDCVVCLGGSCNEVHGMLLLWILAGEAMWREREREREGSSWSLIFEEKQILGKSVSVS